MKLSLLGFFLLAFCATAVSAVVMQKAVDAPQPAQNNPEKLTDVGQAGPNLAQAPDRKTFLPFPLPYPMYHNFQAPGVGNSEQLPGNDQKAMVSNPSYGPGQTPSFYDQLSMMYHPMNPISPMNPINNPLINPVHPMNPSNPITHHIVKRDGTIESVHDEGIPGFGINPMMGMGMGMGFGGNDYGQNPSNDPTTQPIVIPRITVKSKCDSVKRQAVSIANSVMKAQNSIVYKELINYLLKSKFLLGMTEIKLARLLRKRMFSVMKQFSSLSEGSINFVDAKFDDGTGSVDALEDPEIFDSGDFPHVDEHVDQIDKLKKKKKKL